MCPNKATSKISRKVSRDLWRWPKARKESLSHFQTPWRHQDRMQGLSSSPSTSLQMSMKDQKSSKKMSKCNWYWRNSLRGLSPLCTSRSSRKRRLRTCRQLWLTTDPKWMCSWFSMSSRVTRTMLKESWLSTTSWYSMRSRRSRTPTRNTTHRKLSRILWSWIKTLTAPSQFVWGSRKESSEKNATRASKSASRK